MLSSAPFGSARHFTIHMLFACGVGALLGLASGIWDWSYEAVRWTSAIAVVIVVSLALGKEALKPKPPPPSRQQPS